MQSANNSCHRMDLGALDPKANSRKEQSKSQDSLSRSRETYTVVKLSWLTVCKIESVVCPRVLSTRAVLHPKLETKMRLETIASECTKKCMGPLQSIRRSKALAFHSSSSLK